MITHFSSIDPNKIELAQELGPGIGLDLIQLEGEALVQIIVLNSRPGGGAFLDSICCPHKSGAGVIYGFKK
jgi:hypothetical protein